MKKALLLFGLVSISMNLLGSPASARYLTVAECQAECRRQVDGAKQDFCDFSKSAADDPNPAHHELDQLCVQMTQVYQSRCDRVCRTSKVDSNAFPNLRMNLTPGAGAGGIDPAMLQQFNIESMQ